MKCTAFAPGHISGFFEPVYWPNDLERSGSRGSGLCISHGAISEVSIVDTSQQQIDIFLNTAASDAPVTRYALSYLIQDRPLHVLVRTFFDLPLSQGFGMSAAGALSASLALSQLLSLSRHHAIQAAHRAEVHCRTGLGDVIASSFGGVEIRREPGIPPWGAIEHIPGNHHDVVIAVIGEDMQTQSILSDTTRLKDIASTGRYCMKKILEAPSLEQLFSLSQIFSWKTGLAQKKLRDVITQANRYGRASMCMLGNSVFAVGDTERLCQLLCCFGDVWVCEIDSAGVRIL